MSELLKRSLYGAIYVAIVVACVIFSPYATYGLMAFFGIAGFIEIQRIYKKKSKVYGTTLVGILLMIGWSLNAYLNESTFEITTPLVLSFALLVFEHIFTKGSEKSSAGMGTSTMALLYLSIPLSLAPWLTAINEGSGYLPLLAVFIFIWTNDTFAYLIGKALGRNRISKRLSPKKSFEGLVGGVVFAVTAAYLIFKFTDHDLSNMQWVILAIIAGLGGTFGDLFESALKRSSGVKDSGNIIPGHGGILDRIDSFLFVAPLAYLYLSLT